MSSRPTRTARRLASLAITTALAVLAAGLNPAPAPAAAVNLGKLFLTPSTGDQDTFMELNTDDPCPAGTEAIRAKLSGPGITDDLNNNISGNTDYAILDSNAAGGKTVPANSTLKSVFQKYAAPQTATYQIRVICQTQDGATNFGEFTGSISVAATGGFNLTYSQASQAQATSTTLTTSPVDPVATGTQTTLTATVAPAGATGTVQFTRNGASFGAPATVVNGTATFTASLAQGSSQLAATYTPEDPDTYAASTSAAVSYLVVPVPIITGTARVGSSLTCSIPAGGSQSFAWLRNGAVVSGRNGATTTVPVDWYGATITCRATVTKGDHVLAQSSAGVKPAKGAALRNTKKPTISGTTKVGKKLSCKPGSWSPRATSYTYLWKRNSTAIKGGTKPTHTVAKADKKHTLTCTVTATAAAYATGRATSATKRVG